MTDILIRAGSFVAIMILGFILRRIGFFKADTFQVLSKITIKITLPAAIISNFVGKTIDPSMLSLALLSIGAGLCYILVIFLINLSSTKEKRAFDVLNLPGYNIGNFAMPFVQGFLGPAGMLATSLFDSGNSFIVLGGAFSIALMIKDGTGFSFKRMGKALMTSIPFMCYVIMTIVCLCRLPIPKPIASLAQIAGNANPFIAMLMLGVGFKLEANREQLGTVCRILGIRYGLAILFSLVFYFLLPFELEVRQALVILAFSPIGSAVPAFTGEMKGDTGLSSAVNSISIICSIVIMVTLMSVMLT